MSSTTPWAFYDFFVYPNYAEFLDKPNDIRRAFNASLSAFQQADIFYSYYKRHDPSAISTWPSKKQLLIDLGSREPHFVTVESVATVYKHLYAKAVHYNVGSPRDLWGVGIKRGTAVEINWSPGVSTDQVVVRQRGAKEVVLKEALEAVVEQLWPQVLPREPLSTRVAMNVQ
jgi:hypothetical protein